MWTCLRVRGGKLAALDEKVSLCSTEPIRLYRKHLGVAALCNMVAVPSPTLQGTCRYPVCDIKAALLANCSPEIQKSSSVYAKFALIKIIV